jgi:hypothetical protein
MKTLYLIVFSSILLWSAPVMGEQEALALFSKIKKSEYHRVVSLWKQEIRLKTQARTSGRKSIWGDEDEPIDTKDHSSYFPKHKTGTVGIP